MCFVLRISSMWPLFAAVTGGALTGPFAFNGRYLVVTGRATLEAVSNRLYYFELPTSYLPTPATVQDDFETGNAGAWTALPGSQFTGRRAATWLRHRQHARVPAEQHRR
jgi:hypothetical protein